MQILKIIRVKKKKKKAESVRQTQVDDIYYYHERAEKPQTERNE